MTRITTNGGTTGFAMPVSGAEKPAWRPSSKEAETRAYHAWPEPWPPAPLLARRTARIRPVLADGGVVGAGRRPHVLLGVRQRHRCYRPEDQRRDRARRHLVLVPDRARHFDRADQQVPAGRSDSAHRRPRSDLRDRQEDEERILLARQPGPADPPAREPRLVSGDRPLEGLDLRRAAAGDVRLRQLHAIRARAGVVDQLQ